MAASTTPPPEHASDREGMPARGPWIRVDNARIQEDSDRRGEYNVVITGLNLKMAISPPQLIVGDIELENVTFHKHGEEIHGILRKPPKNDVVIVDYGFARGRSALRWSAAGENDSGE